MKNDNSLFYVELGKILKKTRTDKELSLSQLSEIIGSKSKSTIKRYEDGKARVDMDTLAALCDALSLNLNEIVQKASKSSFRASAVGLYFDEISIVDKMRSLSKTHLLAIAEMIDLYYQQDAKK